MKNNCFEISIVIFFTFFINFWGTKLKPFPGKANQKQFKVCQRKYFRNWIWNYLEVKNECSRRLTMDFSFFFTFFSEQVENVFGESKAKHTKLCKSEVRHRKRFRKWFRNYLVVKSRCTTEPLKKKIFSFLHIFKPRSWNRLLWKQGKAFKSLWIQSWSW